jgi:hypothetical protein
VRLTDDNRYGLEAADEFTRIEIRDGWVPAGTVDLIAGRDRVWTYADIEDLSIRLGTFTATLSALVPFFRERAESV